MRDVWRIPVRVPMEMVSVPLNGFMRSRDHGRRLAIIAEDSRKRVTGVSKKRMDAARQYVAAARVSPTRIDVSTRIKSDSPTMHWTN